MAFFAILLNCVPVSGQKGEIVKQGPWRICRISSEFPPPWKGLAPGPYELSLAQARRGNELLVITRHRGNTTAFDQTLPFNIIRISAFKDILFSLKAAILAGRIHQQCPFNVIHAHGFSALGAVFLRRMRILPIPVVAHVHILRATQARQGLLVNQLTLWQERMYLAGADLLLGVSKKVTEESATLAPRTPAINVENGASIERFKPRIDLDAHRELRLLFVGALNGRKGEDDILAACRHLEDKGLPWRLLVVGDGPRRRMFGQLIDRSGLSKKVAIKHYIEYSKMPDVYRWADVFLFPSYSEGMPKAVLEAMACGCPVILSDIPGCRELVEDGKNGFLIPPGRSDLLAEAVMRFVKQPELIKSMAQASRTTVEQRYTWDSVAQRVEECYQGMTLMKQIILSAES